MIVSQAYLSKPRVWAIAGTTVVGGGAWLGWDWLVAAGAAPIMVSVAPCVAMCALGLCMNKVLGRSCDTKSKPPKS